MNVLYSTQSESLPLFSALHAALAADGMGERAGFVVADSQAYGRCASQRPYAWLSTDDEAIAAAGEGCGLEVPFRRPIALASDTAATIDVVVHALDILPGYDLVALLQPTSPLRTAADIDAVIERLVATGAPSCVSVVPVEQSPYWMVRIADNWQIGPLLELPVGVTRRQELPPIYALNGAVYVARVDWLRRERRFVGDGTVAVVMPFERSVDIDTTADLERLEQLINKDLNA